MLVGTISLLGAARLAAQPQPDNASDDIVYEIGNGVIALKPISTPDPEYTDRACKKKLRGTAVVAMIVTPEGNTRDLKVITSLDKDLDQQALAAMSKWKFEPATKDGQPVAVHLKAEANFRIY